MKLTVCSLLATFVIGALAGEVRAEVDETPLPFKTVRAFPELQFDRPIVVTYAKDGSNRVFVAAQKGQILVFPNDPAVEEASVFLDISSKVVYADKQNEEGLLGLAFHPDYKKNGEFFLYYTTTDAPLTSVISRFRVSKDDPNKADPTFEEEVMRIKQPFWNHNGGTIDFGPDGFLYVALGDGGAANDPMKNGQNLSTLLGSILRIDVDRKDEGLGYSIPKDNPFINQKNARPEIWAYGLRNVWRFAFDRETGTMWAGDVGQDLWEEINIIKKGGNYGWNIREALHPFPPNSQSSTKDMIDPIWEYHHTVGKSITGGTVYRGKKLPGLKGYYIYADYVTGLVWGLKYDDKSKAVTANRLIQHNKLPIMSFGEDADGELYLTTTFGALYTIGPAE
jgi:quinoprotein glucose dehydrogenase